MKNLPIRQQHPLKDPTLGDGRSITPEPLMEVRNSPWLMATSYLRDLKGLLPIGLILIGVLPQISWIPHPVMVWLGLAVLATGIINPILAVLTHAIDVSGDRIIFRQGWIFPIVRRGDRGDISAVQVDEPWHLRPAGLASVSISFRGAAHPFMLAGVDRRVARRLEALLVRAPVRPADASGEPSLGAAYESDAVTPHMTPATAVDAAGDLGRLTAFAPDRHEMVATYLTNLTLAAAGGFAGYELLGDVAPLIAPNLRLSEGPLAAAAVALAVVLGLTTAYLRLHGIQVHEERDGTWTVAYGVLDRRRHVIAAGSASAVRLKTGPADVLLGTRRLTISTADLAHATGTDHLRFPAFREARARELAQALTGDALPTLSGVSSVRVLWSAVPLLVAISLLVSRRDSLGWFGVGAVLLAFGSAVALLKLLSGRVHVAGNVLRYRRWSFFGCTEDHVSRSAVQWTVRRRLPSTQWGVATITAYPSRRLVATYLTASAPWSLVSVGRPTAAPEAGAPLGPPEQVADQHVDDQRVADQEEP